MTTTDTTTAQLIVRETLGDDATGTDWSEAFEHAIHHRSAERTSPAEATVRYEFDDGSAIVFAYSAWDYGVHRDRLDTLRDRYRDLTKEPGDDDGRDIAGAWVGAGYGVTEADALPLDSLEKLAHSQDVSPLRNVESLFQTWPGDDDDGFEEAVNELRRSRA